MAVATAAGASPQHALMETARMELIKLRGEMSSEELKVILSIVRSFDAIATISGPETA